MRERLFCMESPTHVGNTHGVLRRGSAPAVHPHACGEYGPHCSAEIMQGGSSPRVWGIRSPASNRASWIAVHPHACGEYCSSLVTDSRFIGSSPRVWGIQALCTPAGCRTRFIPTRVGNTHNSGKTWAGCAVHPRACGEYSVCPSIRGELIGSSPRVWGIQTAGHRQRRGRRFIPTRVGNTVCGGPIRKRRTVHPHACGEYYRPPSYRQ